jgi:hypothetical protein
MMNQDRPGLLAEVLERFMKATETVWEAYGKSGPGKVEKELFEPVEEAWHDLQKAFQDDALVSIEAVDAGPPSSAHHAAIEEAGRNVRDLAHHCVFRIEGLNFIAPEAGLIPRRDLIEKFETSLAELRRRRENLNHRA